MVRWNTVEFDGKISLIAQQAGVMFDFQNFLFLATPLFYPTALLRLG